MQKVDHQIVVVYVDRWSISLTTNNDARDDHYSGCVRILWVMIGHTAVANFICVGGTRGISRGISCFDYFDF